MNNKTTNSCPGGDESNHHRQITGDRVNYQSDDGLVEIHTKVEGAGDFQNTAIPWSACGCGPAREPGFKPFPMAPEDWMFSYAIRK